MRALPNAHSVAVGRFASLLAVSWLALWPAPVAGQADPSGGATLRSGLVIQPSRGLAYVMAPNGGVSAVDLASGATLWTSSEGDRPLTLAGDVLVTQVAPKAAGSRLELVGLDTGLRGARTMRSAIDLPVGVRVSLGETLDGTFSVDARAAGGAVTVTWRFVPMPRRGLAEPEDEQAQPGKRAAVNETSKGAFRVTLSSGAVTRLGAAAVTNPPSPRWIVDSPNQKAGGPTRYESADGRNVVSSERIDDDKVWEKYRWTVFDASGQRLGEFRTHLSFTPFVVAGALVIYETTPFMLRGSPEEPAKLRATDLRTAKEAWNTEVRETVYRGPFPPS